MSFQKFLDHCYIFFKIIVLLYICFIYLYVAFYRGPYGRLLLYINYVILLKLKYYHYYYYFYYYYHNYYYYLQPFSFMMNKKTPLKLEVAVGLDPIWHFSFSHGMHLTVTKIRYLKSGNVYEIKQSFHEFQKFMIFVKNIIFYRKL